MSEKVDDRALGNHVVSHRRYTLGTGPCQTGHRLHMKHGSAREASEYFDVLISVEVIAVPHHDVS